MRGVSAPTCPKCGWQMELVPWSEWTLHGKRAIDAICPNCLHVERIDLAARDGPDHAGGPVIATPHEGKTERR